MDNQRLFIVIAILLSVFLLWDKWTFRNAPSSNVNNVEQSSAVLINENIETASDVPNIETEAVSLDIDKNESYESHPYTNIKTDLLTVEVSHKGGAIQNAYLNTYPLELGSQEKFQLLSNKKGSVFQAQSGLASKEESLPSHLSMFSSDRSNYEMTNNELVVPFTWKSENGVEVTKTYRFKRGSYIIELDYEIINNSNNPIGTKSYVRLERDFLEQSNMMMPTFTGGIVYDKASDSVQKNKFEDWSDFDTEIDERSIGGWMAMVQQYFVAAWVPKQDEEQKYSATVVNNLYKLTDVGPQITINPGTSVTMSPQKLYIGPKEYGNVEKVATGLNYTLDYGWLDILADPLSWIIHKVNYYVNSWGWSIIIITFMIKLAFYPLSEKSYKSMAGMRKLAPRLEKIKKTYGDDKQKMGQKTMELYKKEKINPASGCLPIIVQIPVFIAFYWMLLDTVELRQMSFFYLPDLSAKDPYYILPILMGASMLFQQKLNPPPADPMQAKIMMALPFVFTIFFLWFPSGLVLYWVVNNTLSIAQQWTINKRING
ncbi:MAG: membrane protein insertase YidC [Gammaproteobacteria bacterium]|nr:membrane protein insertase YidC [Gammaproteobacteria bacterium]